MSTDRHFITDRTGHVVLIREVPVGSCSFFMSRQVAWDQAQRLAKPASRAQDPKRRSVARIEFQNLDGMRTVIKTAEATQAEINAEATQEAPKPEAVPMPAPVKVEVPAGRYAIENNGLKFYRVDRPEKGKWAGYTFVKVQASDTLYPIKNRQERERILSIIAENPKEASIRYGKELGCCGVCARTLTDPESIEAGIGPICAGKF